MDAWVGNPELHGDELVWKCAEESADVDMLRPASEPFQADGGLRLVAGQSRPRRVQDQRGRRGALDRRGAGALLLRPERGARRLQGRRARPRLCGRGPIPGAARQRHARAAQADADARRACRTAGTGRAGHRRTHVGRERQGAGRDPRLPRGAARRAARAGSRRRRHPARRAQPARSRRSVSILPSRPPANSPPPPVGTGRELFAMMRMHVQRSGSGRIGDARSDGSRATLRRRSDKM